jgi:hypothetical protein
MIAFPLPALSLEVRAGVRGSWLPNKTIPKTDLRPT